MACQTLPVLKYTNLQISVDKPAAGTLRCLKTCYIGVIILDSKRQHDFTRACTNRGRTEELKFKFHNY